MERKFWIAVGVLTFAPFAITAGATVLGMLSGAGNAGFEATTPLFVFGMTMVGVLYTFGNIDDLLQRKRGWLGLLLGVAWTLFFGRMFLQTIGVQV